MLLLTHVENIESRSIGDILTSVIKSDDHKKAPRQRGFPLFAKALPAEVVVALAAVAVD